MDPSPSEPVAPPIQPQATSSQPTWTEGFNQVDGYAEQLRLKLPLAPPGLLNGYMNVAPWVAIVFGVLFGLISLIGLAGSTLFSTFAVMFGSTGSGFGWVLSSLLSLVVSIVIVVAGILMLRRRINGWWLMAVGIVVSLLSSLLHTSALGLIFWLLIAYIHLQVKPNYTN
jgi:hypothetical protein